MKFGMTEFKLFDEALKVYNTNAIKDNCTLELCKHDKLSVEKGATICLDCGEEISEQLSHDSTKDWKYEQNETRKIDERSIFKDVETLGFSETIVSKANKIYSQVTKGKIFRGNSRKAIVFACIFHAYKLCGKPQSHEKLIKIFNLNRKTGLKGLKHVNLYAPKESNIRNTYITPINLIDEIMDQFGATIEQKLEVVQLYNIIKNKSSKLNRSRPQSVASGLVYYWILKKGKHITLKDFTKKVTLSELTINKIAKEIGIILEEEKNTTI